MKKQRHFGTANGIAERDAAVIAAMMDDLGRIVEILDCDVATEEERARVFDRSDQGHVGELALEDSGDRETVQPYYFGYHNGPCLLADIASSPLLCPQSGSNRRSLLLDYDIGAQQNRGRQFDVDRLSGLEINSEFELGR